MYKDPLVNDSAVITALLSLLYLEDEYEAEKYLSLYNIHIIRRISK